jgi:xanthine/uracil/vitamin C permease (AzgA family)
MSDERDQRANETEDQGTGAREAQAANLFDLRRIIGGLFVLYGVVLTIVGLGDSDAEIEKAAGVHINLWAGLGMLALGALFIAWALLRPLGKQMQEEERKRQERAGEAS